ncbi:MAG TPA: NAD(P)H-hydrate dehydratase [Lapillicoccus sp.]|nr:NAD(P)H-hydrate dehydratase [Lapillicoccus sp.]
MRTVDSALLRTWSADRDAPGRETGGRLLIVGGSRQTPGAVRLAAEAALRAGAETVQVLTVRSTAPAFAVAVPELFVAGVDETADGEIAPGGFGQAAEMAEQADVVLVGPGFMSPRAAVDLCRPLLPRLSGCRVVIDALAMAVFAAEPAFRFADGQAILSPNSGELGLALDEDPKRAEEDPADAARRLTRRANAVVTSGSATTYVAAPGGEIWVDRAGHDGLAASGSGDVKAGIIAAAFGHLADAEKAAVWGGHVHARAGELVASRVGRVGFLASEVVTAVPEVLTTLTA